MKGNLKKAEHYYVEACFFFLDELEVGLRIGECHVTTDVAGFCCIFLSIDVFSYLFSYLFRTFPFFIGIFSHLFASFRSKTWVSHQSAKAKMWTSAMSMYRQLEQWEDAKRVAKVGERTCGWLQKSRDSPVEVRGG